MFKKRFVPFALSSLLLASPLALSEEAHHPGQDAALPQEVAAAVSGAGDKAPAETSGGMMEGSGMMGQGMMGQGMMDQGTGEGQQDDTTAGGAMQPGMMMGGPGTMRGPGGMMQGGRGGGMGMGMMRQGMMGGMQDDDDAQGGMMMGRGGMGGMMHGGKSMMGHEKGQGMHKHYRKLVGRLDLLEARMAKIETLLERLIQR